MSKSITAGVDFGNQTCILSVPTRYGVDIVLNQSSNRKTPTIIGYQEEERRFSGEFALQQQMVNISNTITNIKQLIGLRYDTKDREELSKAVSFKIVPLNDSEFTGIQIGNSVFQTEQILAYFLKSLQEIIQIKNSKIKRLVLSIPPWWNEVQKRCVLNAAKIAKIDVAAFIDSFSAASISYLKIHSDRFEDEKKINNVVFVEIGDTSLNVSVSSLSKKMIEMRSFEYDRTINGQFFTSLLEDFLLKKVSEKYKIDPKTNKRSMIRFNQAAEKVKKALSANPVIMFEIPSLINDVDVSIPVKRDEFNDLIESHIEKVVVTIEKALKKSNLSKEDISTVELLGGGSRIPAIKNKIKEFFGFDPMMSLDLDECFAVGAGFMAAKVDGYDIGIDSISSVYPFDVDAEYKTQNDEKIQKINMLKNGTQIPTNSIFTIPVLNKNVVCLMNKNDEKIGNIEIQTGINDVVDVDVTASVDSYGLINIVDAKLKKNKDENIDENDNENVNDNKEENNNENVNENVNDNKEEKIDENDNENVNDNKEENNNENVNDNKEEKIDENNNENVSDNKEENNNENVNDNKEENNNENVNDNKEENNNENVNDNKEDKIDENENEKVNKNMKSKDENEDNLAQPEEVKVSFIYTPFTVLSKKSIDEYIKIEEDMEIKDRLEIEIDNTKNDLESLIFTTLNELNSVKISNDTEQEEINKIKEKVNEIFAWFSENEFERLTLDEYKSKISEIKIQIDLLNHHKKYHDNVNKLNELKQKLTTDLEIVLNDKERIQLKESVGLQKEIPKLISKIDETQKSTKKEVCEFDISSFEKNVDEIDFKSKSLKNIPLNIVNEIEETKKVTISQDDQNSEHQTTIKEDKTKTDDNHNLLIEEENKIKETESNPQRKEQQNTSLNNKTTEESTIKQQTLNEKEISQNQDIKETKSKSQENTEQQSSINEKTKEEFSDKSNLVNDEFEIKEKVSSNQKEEIKNVKEPTTKHSFESSHVRNKMHVRKCNNVNNNEHLIKLDILKKYRPLSNNQKNRIKLPPLLSLNDEETNLLSEDEMKNFDTINMISPPNSPFTSQLNQQKETTNDCSKEKNSNLPPLKKNLNDKEKNESIKSIKSFRRPIIPNQPHRKTGSFLRFHTA